MAVPPGPAPPSAPAAPAGPFDWSGSAGVSPDPGLPTQAVAAATPVRRLRHRILPRSVLGISSMILAFSLGASLSGVVLYSYYEYRLGQARDDFNSFGNNFKSTVANATNSIKAQQAAATAQIQQQLGPLQKLAAQGNELQALVAKTAPALYFVHTVDANGQASVGTAFAVATDSHQTLLLTSYTTVKEATKKPGPPGGVIVGKGTGPGTSVTVYTWDEAHDLALIILPVGNQPKLTFAGSNPSVGSRVFALSGLGSQGAAITQGFVADVSSAGIQHDAPTGQAFQGGPLMDSDGNVIGILSRSYAPLNFATDTVWFAVLPKDACSKVLSCPNNTPTGAGNQGGT